jgi:hypothetical protein
MATLGLVVPVNLEAFCAGTIDARTGTNTMAGATTQYTDQATTENPALLGGNVSISFLDAPWQQLEQGVHLHWALPDTLTKAAVIQGSLQFPPAPNRWLVTRILINGTAASARSWVVESDALNESPVSGQLSVTLPVKTAQPTDQNYRWVGSYSDFDGNWVYRRLRGSPP